MDNYSEDSSELNGNILLNFDIEQKQEEGLYEQIMEKSTFTKNRIKIMICMIFVFIADGMEMTVFNFIIKPYGEYFNLEETDVEIQVTASSLFFGIIIGSAIAGLVTKKFGRLLTVNCSNLIFFISHLIMGIWINIPVFIIFRIVSGLALGIIVPIFMNIFGEYLPERYRGLFLMIAWSFYGIGQLVTNIIGLGVMPELQQDKLKMFVLILTIFPFLGFISCIFLLNDSPRGLLLSKNIRDNRTSIQALNEINQKELNSEQEEKLRDEVKTAEIINESYSFKHIIKEMFEPELKKTTILIILIFICLGYNAFGIYSISSYFLDYLDEVENGKKEGEERETPARDIIINQIMFGVAEFASNYVGGFVGEIRKLGRKGGIMIFTILAGILIIVGLFKKILFEVTSPISSGFNTIYVNLAMDYVVEIYPTKIRDTSTSLLFMIYRISCFLSNYISLGTYEIHKFIPYIIFAISTVLICFFTWGLPYEMVAKEMK